MEKAVATLGAPATAVFRCDHAFAVLPKAIAWFVSVGDGAGASRFERPSVLNWQPKKGARHHKADALPSDLLGSVRLFISAGSEGPFVYVGKTELIPQFRCDFETRVQVTPKLRPDVWVRFGGYRGWKLQIDKDPAAFGTDVELRGRLDAIRQAERADVSLSRYEEDVLHVLFAGDRAFLMYLPEIGEAGMSSRNPGYQGSPKDRVVFRAANGEDTALPASFTVSKGEALRAIEEFLRAGRLPKFITWQDD
jgi:hypothetical protein